MTTHQSAEDLDKAHFRRLGRERRAALSAGERDAKSRQICARLLEAYLELARDRPPAPLRIAVYLANEGEASVDEFARQLIARGATIAAPRMNIEPPFYTLQKGLNNVEIILLKQHFLRQPQRFQGGHAVETNEIGVFIVPGVAFDIYGNRVGQGGGWYDKVLCKVPRAHVIGVCFDCQVFPTVPTEEHDRAMDSIVTESRTIKTDSDIS